MSQLRIYKKSVNNVACLIGDNCATNRKIADLMGVPLIGCYSHRLNLAADDFLENATISEGTVEVEAKIIVNKVSLIMKELKTLKNSDHLRVLTDLKPIRENDTRWTSRYEMMRRYVKIKDEINK